MRVDLWDKQTGAWVNGIEAASIEAAAALFPDATANVLPGASGYMLVDGVAVAPPAPPAPPRVILAGWFKAAISQMGKAAAVAAAVSQQPEWKQILWNAATHIREDDADVMAIAAALNIDLSAVFDRAEEIRAATRGGV